MSRRFVILELDVKVEGRIKMLPPVSPPPKTQPPLRESSRKMRKSSSRLSKCSEWKKKIQRLNLRKHLTFNDDSETVSSLLDISFSLLTIKNSSSGQEDDKIGDLGQENMDSLDPEQGDSPVTPGVNPEHLNKLNSLMRSMVVEDNKERPDISQLLTDSKPKFNIQKEWGGHTQAKKTSRQERSQSSPDCLLRQKKNFKKKKYLPMPYFKKLTSKPYWME